MLGPQGVTNVAMTVILIFAGEVCVWMLGYPHNLARDNSTTAREQGTGHDYGWHHPQAGAAGAHNTYRARDDVPTGNHKDATASCRLSHVGNRNPSSYQSQGRSR